jgi:hypothetical protein
MAEKLEFPNSIITRIVKEGAQESLCVMNERQQADTGVIITKDAKQAYQ